MCYLLHNYIWFLEGSLEVPLVPPHVAVKPGHPLVKEGTPINRAGVEAVLGVLNVGVLVNKHTLTDYALNGT